MRILCIAVTAGMIPLWFVLWGGACRQRVLVLEDMLHVVRDLRHYAAATGESVGVLLRRISLRTACADRLRECFLCALETMPVQTAWETAVTKELWEKRGTCGITVEDRTALEIVGCGMGSFLTRQQELLSDAQTELERLLERARADEHKTRGLYRRLGWIAAGMAVILLW